MRVGASSVIQHLTCYRVRSGKFLPRYRNPQHRHHEQFNMQLNRKLKRFPLLSILKNYLPIIHHSYNSSQFGVFTFWNVQFIYTKPYIGYMKHEHRIEAWP
jgi:hypothetical protein